MALKLTEAQIGRAVKKLAIKAAEANYVRAGEDSQSQQQINRLYDVLMEAFKLCRKLGAEKHYHDRMKLLLHEENK